MRQFDFYEFAAALAPGATFLFGASILLPEVREALQPSQGLTIGDLGLFMVLAYVAGHLIQAGGNGLESLWWKLWGGWPTDWPRIGKHDLVSEPQREQIRVAIRKMLILPEENYPFTIKGAQWAAVVRQVDATVQAAERSKRVDIFNGTYGLNRGIASALLALSMLGLLCGPCSHWRFLAVCSVGAVIAVYRKHRFGRHYGRELYVQFLQASSFSNR